MMRKRGEHKGMAAKSTELGSHSNLQSFLNSTTPTVPSLSIPRTYVRNINSLWQPDDKDKVDFFRLANLWEQYDEWSAYGVSVPFRLKTGEPVTQYYTPYLSAIQIYTTENLVASSICASKKVGEGYECDSLSTDQTNGEKSSRLSNGVREVSGSDHEGSWPTREHIGHLYFEFVDHSSPYERLPLVGKVHEFAKSYPGLTNFWSADLSPASWMSVAWYPIYQIPSQRGAQEFSTCFLTYHTISTSLEDGGGKLALRSGKDAEKNNQVRKHISLPSFGLSSYKMKGSFWRNPRAGDPETFSTLYSAADSWLKQLKFRHDDFNFFRMHMYSF